MEEFKVINFEINFNKKLLCDRFIIIDDFSSLKNFNVNDKINIKIREQHFCFSVIEKKETKLLEEIIKQNLHIFDRGLSDKEYVKLWDDKLNKKLTILYLLKTTQLRLFEDEN